jgi:hypothetical protein
MAREAYHTNSLEYPPSHRDVYHNDLDCPNGKQIKKEHRVDGTAGRPLCKHCE